MAAAAPKPGLLAGAPKPNPGVLGAAPTGDTVSVSHWYVDAACLVALGVCSRAYCTPLVAAIRIYTAWLADIQSDIVTALPARMTESTMLNKMLSGSSKRNVCRENVTAVTMTQ